MPASDTRQQIVDAADRLIRARGFQATSFADIAEAVGLSRGNFYYHFRTKDAILAAVIAHRIAETRTMLTAWEAAWAGPLDQIVAFARLPIVNQASIMAHGCPVGSLCAELARIGHGAAPEAAGLFALFRDWLAARFAALGRDADAAALALHVLMRSQGIAMLATALSDPDFVRREVADLERWVRGVVAAGPSPLFQEQPCS